MNAKKLLKRNLKRLISIIPTRKDLKRSFNYFKGCKRILDVGSGTGEFVKLAPHRITGIDINGRNNSKIKYGSATAIPFPKNSFDGLHCSHVIEHLPPLQVYKFLRESARVLKPHGILVISSPLLWSGFYDNLTHIKPYPPRAIMRYLVETAPDTTYPAIKSKFKLVKLHWRYRYLTKTGYTLILRKC